MYQPAYLHGVKTAAAKFAVDAKNLTELAGLGMLAAPAAHDLVSGHEESPAMHKAKSILELGGLGTLAYHPLKELLAHGR